MSGRTISYQYCVENSVTVFLICGRNHKKCRGKARLALGGAASSAPTNEFSYFAERTMGNWLEKQGRMETGKGKQTS